MIRLTKINDEEFILNCKQIERIEMIPESKVILTSGKHYIVKESPDDIIQQVIDFNAKIYALGNKLK